MQFGPQLAITVAGCLLFAAGGAEARGIGGRRALKTRQQRQQEAAQAELVPIYGELDDFAVNTPTTTSIMMSSEPENAPTPQQAMQANVLLLEPAAPPTSGDSIGSASRTFHHKFLMNGYNNGGGGGYAGNNQIPYIIINNPTNVSNINNNSLINPPAAAAAAGLRVNYVRAQESQPFMLTAQQPQLQSQSQPQYAQPQYAQQTLTPVVYQRRDNNDNTILLQALPQTQQLQQLQLQHQHQQQQQQQQPASYSVALPTIVMGSADLMGQNLGGGAMLMPLGLRNYMELAGNRRPERNQRQGLRFRPFGGMMSGFGNGGGGGGDAGLGNNGNGNSNINPFVSFANNLRRIQFL